MHSNLRKFSLKTTNHKWPRAEKEYAYISIYRLLCNIPEINTTLQINYISIKKVKKKTKLQTKTEKKKKKRTAC